MSQSSEEDWESGKKGKGTQVVYSTTAEIFKL
jgi:hypothetical protein